MDYVTGQIYGWNGGECPVHPETKLKIWIRNSVGYQLCNAVDHWWDHSNHDGDIIAFQVITPYAEPKVIYVNEYYDGSGAAYPSEERAKRADGGYHTRVAVKYVEAKE